MANEVADMKYGEFSPANVEAYVRFVASSPAGGKQKADALLNQLIATRFQLYAIEVQDNMVPGMGTAGVRSLSYGLKADITKYVAFQKNPNFHWTMRSSGGFCNRSYYESRPYLAGVSFSSY